mgnify:CR=1 FL=1
MEYMQDKKIIVEHKGVLITYRADNDTWGVQDEEREIVIVGSSLGEVRKKLDRILSSRKNVLLGWYRSGWKDNHGWVRVRTLGPTDGGVYIWVTILAEDGIVRGREKAHVTDFVTDTPANAALIAQIATHKARIDELEGFIRDAEQKLTRLDSKGD